jgi:chromosome segregation ATPase
LRGSNQSLISAEEDNRALLTENAALRAQLHQLTERSQVIGQETEGLRAVAATAARHETELRTRLEETSRAFAEKEYTVAAELASCIRASAGTDLILP